MKKQVIVMHGGDSFDSYKKFLDSLKNWEVSVETFLPRRDWKMNLPQDLGEDFQVLMPRMPNKDNAKYAEWKIWFERMLPFVEDGVILVGHSLGGIFLVKYLSENGFSKKIGKLVLVAPPHNQTAETGDFILTGPISGLVGLCQEIHLFQSKDDQIVPASEAERYKDALPEIQLHIFEDRGHFNQEQFPEMVKEIMKA